MTEIFADTMLADLNISRSELVELSDTAPSVAEGITRLYTAVREMQRRPDGGEERRADLRSLITPETWVRDYIQAQRNHFPELEERSETLAALSRPLSVAEPLRGGLRKPRG